MGHELTLSVAFSFIGSTVDTFILSSSIRMSDLAQYHSQMSVHVSWKDLGEGGLTSARNNLEKYVMTKIYDIAMAGQVSSKVDVDVIGGLVYHSKHLTLVQHTVR